LSIEVGLVRKSIETVTRHREELRRRYYELLFEIAPGLREFLDGDRRRALGDMFDEGIRIVVEHFESPDDVEYELADLGHRFDSLRPLLQNDSVLREILLQALAEIHGEAWTSKLEAAWDEAVGMGLTLIKQALTYTEPL
jgi:hemoglobin-like flavoprotein